jgi:hypothetical protein
MKPIKGAMVDKALAKKAWDLGNEVLYDLCKRHPTHKTDQEIIAKVWLIGRSYSAAIERHKIKSANAKGDKFYERKVAPKIRRSEIDKWLARLKKEPTAALAIETHSKLTNLFCDITKLKKRSLASKYLHFHFPKLFFIYDSRSVAGINKIKLSAENELPSLSLKNPDTAYSDFYQRCQSLQENLQTKFGWKRKPLPREVDKILLHNADKV